MIDKMSHFGLRLFAEFNLKRPNNLPDITGKDQGILNNVISFIFAFLALLAVLFIVIGGVQYTLSNGEANKIQEAKNTILYAVMGLMLCLVAFIVVSFVMSSLQGV